MENSIVTKLFTMLVFVLSITLLLSGCNLFDAKKKEPEPEIEQYFRADLNGEQWSGNPAGGFMIREDGRRWLSFNATWIDTMRYPYQDLIRFAVPFDTVKLAYNVIPKLSDSRFQLRRF